MHQQMHMFAFLAGRFALDRALLEACAQFVCLLVCLVLLVCVLARSGLLVYLKLVAPRPSSRCVLHSQMHFI